MKEEGGTLTKHGPEGGCDAPEPNAPMLDRSRSTFKTHAVPGSVLRHKHTRKQERGLSARRTYTSTAYAQNWATGVLVSSPWRYLRERSAGVGLGVPRDASR
jgi:hypothetical protein